MPVVFKTDDTSVCIVLKQHDIDILPTRICHCVIGEVTEDGADERHIALYLHPILKVNMQSHSFLFGHEFKLITYAADDVVKYNILYSNKLAAVLHTCYQGDVIKEAAQPVIVDIASLYQLLAFLIAKLDARQQSLKAYLKSGHGSFQLMIDIVCKVLLYPDLLFFLSHCRLVCHISVNDSLLPLGIKPNDMI